jgi:hypothetical protein
MSVRAGVGQGDLDWLPDMIEYMNVKGAVANSRAQNIQNEIGESTYEWANQITEDPDDLRGYVSMDPGFYLALARKFAIDNGERLSLPSNWRKMDPDEQAAFIVDAYSNDDYGKSHWHQAIEEGLPTALAGMNAATANTEADYIDSTAASEPPDLILFDGYYGTDADTVEGLYQIADVKTYRLDSNQRRFVREFIDERDLPEWCDFDSYRLITVRPMSPAWMPQKPEDVGKQAPLDHWSQRPTEE